MMVNTPGTVPNDIDKQARAAITMQKSMGSDIFSRWRGERRVLRVRTHLA